MKYMTTDNTSLNQSTQSTQPEPQNEEVTSKSVVIPEEISESIKVLSSFCVDAPTVEVRDCIRQYSASKTYKQQTSTFNTYSKNVLTATLEFLGVDKNWDQLKKSACVHELIYRIQNLLPETCAICNDTYTIKKDDSPVLSCSICKHEVHRECYLPLLNSAVNNVSNVPGFHYLCPSCEEDLIPDEMLGLKKSVKLSVDNVGDMHDLTNDPKNKTVDIPANKQIDKQSGKLSENPPDKIQSTSLANKPKPKPPHPIEPNVVVAKDNKKIDVNKKPPSPPIDPVIVKSGEMEMKGDGQSANGVPKPTPICRNYKNNQCNHGISGKGCNYSHPKRCAKLMKHGTRADRGCNLGAKCPEFHPKMCQMSITKHECFDNSCKHCHVKGTKRKRTKLTEKDKKKSEETIQKPNNTTAESNPIEATVNPSFLDHVNLLRRELQEVMDKKLTALLQMQQQQIQQKLQFPANQPQIQFAPLTMQCPQQSTIPWVNHYQRMLTPQTPMMGYY